jgi:hypothetical protein
MPETGTIHQIARRDAFKMPDMASTWVHIFTSYGVPTVDFQKIYKDLFTRGSGALGLPRPVWFAFSDLENFKVPHIKLEAFPGSDGEMILYQHNYEVSLPKSSFVLLATPYRDGDVIYRDAQNILERIRGLFCMLFGTNFLHQKVMSAEIFNYPSTRIEQITKNIKFVSPASGPYVHVNNLHEIEEIANAIAELQETNKIRIESAIHYFVRGLEDDDTFLFFWTAIEMLSGKQKNGSKFVREVLRSIYSEVDINKEFGFNKLENLRDDWVHKGEIPDINHDTLRYMQLMFLDILRFKLGLSTKKHLEAICRSPNFNLSDVGLSSNNIPRARPMARQASPEENMLRTMLWCQYSNPPSAPMSAH